MHADMSRKATDVNQREKHRPCLCIFSCVAVNNREEGKKSVREAHSSISRVWENVERKNISAGAGPWKSLVPIYITKKGNAIMEISLRGDLENSTIHLQQRTRSKSSS